MESKPLPSEFIGRDHAAWRDYYEELGDLDHEELRNLVLRYRKLYEEVARQLTNAHRDAMDIYGIELPSPGDGH